MDAFVLEEKKASRKSAAGAASFVLSAILLLCAAFLMCSLLWTVISFGSLAHDSFGAPGRFLYSVYGFSSFLIPLFLLTCSISLLIQESGFPLYFLLLTSLIPFFTAFGGEKLIRAVIPQSGGLLLSKVIFFGLLAATVLAVIAEYLLLFQLALRIERKAAARKSGTALEKEKIKEKDNIKEASEGAALPADGDIAGKKAAEPAESAAAAPRAGRKAPAHSSAFMAEAAKKAARKAEGVDDAVIDEATGEFLSISPKAQAVEKDKERAEEEIVQELAAYESAEAHSNESALAEDSLEAGESLESGAALADEAEGGYAEEAALACELDGAAERGLLYDGHDEAEEELSEAADAMPSAKEEAIAAEEGALEAEEPQAQEALSLIPDVEFDPAMFEGYIAGNFSVLDEEELEELRELEMESERDDGNAAAEELGGFEGDLDADELAAGDCMEEMEEEEDSDIAIAESPAAKESALEPAAAGAPAIQAAAPPAARSAWLKYQIPSGILNTYPDGEYWVIDEGTQNAAAALKETLNEFNIQADVTGIRKGPVITMFEILPAPGVKLSKIVGLQDNIALRLAASSVRIVAPIPGKHAVGIEVPNQKRAIVSFRELIEADSPDSRKMGIPVMLGKDITGEAQIVDLTATPHLLIAGSTGSGKSVCVNSIILSILYKRSPAEVRLILIDPKVVELKLYNDIGHLLAPVITEPKKAFQALQYCLCEMERRYAVLDGMGVRNIKEYNKRIEERGIAAEKLPYIVVIIDEFADLMATTGKELESTVARLAAMSRAVGIHLVLATQRPSIDVITGLIKANIPSRIAFMVASKMDSRIIIDQVGAEKLLGKGDMLYSSVTDPFPTRIQGAFVSDEEVERVVEQVRAFGEPEYIDDEIFVDDDADDSLDGAFFGEGEDPLYDKALEIVLSAGKASASYIQRRLKIGYNRAARLVEDMEARGIVGPANGSKPREVIRVPDRATEA